jgi:hypothetical protein
MVEIPGKNNLSYSPTTQGASSHASSSSLSPILVG